ncbi:RDD family protein [Flagellimonas sp.]|uniref:RDD family protein n=1 Tax=Flagellimonas sp. TaxID=2058762 RepID=UPI003F49F2AF
MKKEYALLPDRVKAAFIDAVILVASMYLTSEILNLFDSVPDYVRISLFIAFTFLYEPIFVSVFGQTLGHSYSGIRVERDNDSGKHVIFPLALLRSIIKYILGWLSFLTVTGDEHKKAIHDHAAKSIVVKDN